MTSRTVQGVLATVDWSNFRSLGGRRSRFVPAAVELLFEARTTEDGEAAYWLLDNEVVVQRALLPAAEPVAMVAMVAATTAQSAEARRRFVDLLVEIALGTAHDEAVSEGLPDLGDRCREVIRRGLWAAYSLLDSEDPQVRSGALEILEAVETNKKRLAIVAGRLADQDSDHGVRLLANEIRDAMQA